MTTARKHINHILIIKEPTNKRFFLLASDRCSLGRNNDNDIIVKDKQVSRYHATIFKKTLKNFEEQIWIYDGDLKQKKKSSNGLKINEKLYSNYCLKKGDCILIGHNVTLQYYQFTEETLALLKVIKIAKQNSQSSSQASQKKFKRQTSILTNVAS